jgi:hypothetical protein
MAGVMVYGLIRRLGEDRPAERCFVVSWLLSVLIFYMIAGPGALAPHYERYGMCLVLPTVLALSLGLAWWMERPGNASLTARCMGLAIGALMLASFYQNYFAIFERTGGTSHPTFRTAAVEPKVAAFRLIAAQASDERRGRIRSAEWWNVLPLRYLAFGNADLDVEEWDEAHLLSLLAAPSINQQIWFVEFTDGRPAAFLRRTLGRERIHWSETMFVAPNGRPILSVFVVK